MLVMTSIDKFWITLALAATNTYIIEVYNSDVRLYGIAFCNFLGKFCVTLFPTFCLFLYG